MESDERITQANKLLDDFSNRTGITGNEGDPSRRYLWTDAFAVQAYFGIARIFENKEYRIRALKLIDLVHEHLGRHHPEDPRKGWISGLPEEEGKLHPTSGGLRIGKRLPERRTDESYNSQLEWERDGQYFHYITRWVTALLQAGDETGEERYALWARELMLAAGKFLFQNDSGTGIYWKMDTELTKPLVASMGAHDPLEGLICAKSIQQALPENASKLDSLVQRFEQLCNGREWSTSDSLGIGGLLLNTLRAALLVSGSQKLIPDVKPKKLLEESLFSLRIFSSCFNGNQSVKRRLAFRECGLSLGLRALYGMRNKITAPHLPINKLEEYLYMPQQIEDFWLLPENQQAASWRGHLDINEISLACSLVASQEPEVF